jgi:hypothetical protein
VAIAGQLAFVAAWLIGGWLEPGYSTANQTVSELAAFGAANPWVLWIGLLALSLSDSAVALLLRDRASLVGRLPAAMFALAAVGILAILAFPLDCMTNGDPMCSARVDAGAVSWQHSAHSIAATSVQLLLVSTPFAVAWGLRGNPLARWALLAGVVGVATVLAVAASGPGEVGYGIWQRITFGFVNLWVIALSVAAFRVRGDRPGGE